MKNGQVVRVMVYFIEYRGAVYHFVGYTSPQLFGYFSQRVSANHARLRRNPRSADLEPRAGSAGAGNRLATGALRDLIPKSLPAPLKPEDVAILNQVTLKAEIEAGRILKVPGARL